MKMDKPKWWPENPWPESMFPMKLERYAEIVPDPELRTGLSGALGREFWEIASDTIWSAVQDNLQAENKEMREYILNEARHSAGCSREFGEKYRCRCGLLEFQQALKQGKD